MPGRAFPCELSLSLGFSSPSPIRLCCFSAVDCILDFQESLFICMCVILVFLIQSFLCNTLLGEVTCLKSCENFP